MREIKFRGKRKDNGEWVYGYIANICGESFMINCRDGDEVIALGQYDIDVCEVIPETVGQWTGRTDTNNKEIYEGDILKTDIDFSPIYIVKSIEDYWSDCGYMSEIFENAKFEVIGNIYENPELVKGVK